MGIYAHASSMLKYWPDHVADQSNIGEST